jgi:hypothetical protein
MILEVRILSKRRDFRKIYSLENSKIAQSALQLQLNHTAIRAKEVIKIACEEEICKREGVVVIIMLLLSRSVYKNETIFLLCAQTANEQKERARMKLKWSRVQLLCVVSFKLMLLNGLLIVMLINSWCIRMERERSLFPLIGLNSSLDSLSLSLPSVSARAITFL